MLFLKSKTSEAREVGGQEGARSGVAPRSGSGGRKSLLALTQGVWRTKIRDLTGFQSLCLKVAQPQEEPLFPLNSSRSTGTLAELEPSAGRLECPFGTAEKASC